MSSCPTHPCLTRPPLMIWGAERQVREQPAPLTVPSPRPPPRPTILTAPSFPSPPCLPLLPPLLRSMLPLPPLLTPSACCPPSQENDALLIKPEDRDLLQSICDRERCIMQVREGVGGGQGGGGGKGGRSVDEQTSPASSYIHIARSGGAVRQRCDDDHS